MKLILAALAASGLFVGTGGLRAQPVDLLDASAASGGAPVERPAIIRETTLADLGYPEGLEFGHLAGQATLYFPVPDLRPVEGGSLHLTLRHGASNDVERHLQVSVAGRVVETLALQAAGGALRLTTPIDVDDVLRGFVAIGLQYSGVYTDRVCVDERVAGDFLTIEPTSGLALALNPSRIDTPALWAAFMPADLRIRLAGDTPSDLAVAMHAAAAYGGEDGHVSYGSAAAAPAGGIWRSAQIVVVPSNASVPPGMTVVLDGAAPVLQIAGVDPQVGLSQLRSPWAGLADAAAIRPGATRATGPEGMRIPLTGLDGDLGARPVSFETGFDIPFGAADVPAGTRVGSVSLIVAAGLDPRGRGASVTAFLNGSLLGSRTLESGDPERMTFDVPNGLAGRSNLIRVLMQRQAVGGECTDKVQAYPAQILPGSSLDLVQDASAPDDFFRLTQTFADGVALVVDPALDLSQEDLVAWVAGVTASILPDGAEVRPEEALDGNATPFVFVSSAPPAGSDPRVVLNDGGVEIRDSAGDLMFDGPALDRIGIVQIVTVGGVDGLWIRPGVGPAPAPSERDPLILDRGDLALIDGTGIAVTTSTRRPGLIAITYPDRTGASRILSTYRPWIIGGIWVVVTLLTLEFFRRIYRTGPAAGAGGGE